MRTHAVIEQHGTDGGSQLLVVLFSALPALFALLCAIRLSYDSQYSGSGPSLLNSGPWLLSSGLWFFYEASRTLGYMGIAVAVTITAVANNSADRLRDDFGLDGVVDPHRNRFCSGWPHVPIRVRGNRELGRSSYIGAVPLTRRERLHAHILRCCKSFL